MTPFQSNESSVSFLRGHRTVTLWLYQSYPERLNALPMCRTRPSFSEPSSAEREGIPTNRRFLCVHNYDAIDFKCMPVV